MHADALAARLVLAPASFDVVVGSNLFGDLLSEVTAAIAGAIGIAPSANLNPEGTYPSLFEPIHGSAPDIAGQATANPWSTRGDIILEHAGSLKQARTRRTRTASDGSPGSGWQRG